MSFGLGEIDIVRDFAFCRGHGFELCHHCCTDQRMLNNIRIEEYMESLVWTADDSKEEAMAVALDDDRDQICARDFGHLNGKLNAEGENVYECNKHNKEDCEECFLFSLKILENLGVLQPHHTAAEPIGTIERPPSPTERPTKEQRRRLCRPGRPIVGIVPPMSDPSSPRRFIPPFPTTKPMDIFNEGYDRSVNQFKRFIHRQDDSIALFFVDGACLDQGNPERRRAGCGVVWNNSDEGTSWPLEGKVGGPEQTNNRAELRAVILWIQLRIWEAGGFDRMIVATDSEYVVEGICSRVDKWIKKGWRTAAGTPVAHRDLWEILLAELAKMDRAEVEILFWLIPRSLNGKADALAKAGAEREDRGSQFQKLRGVML